MIERIFAENMQRRVAGRTTAGQLLNWSLAAVDFQNLFGGHASKKKDFAYHSRLSYRANNQAGRDGGLSGAVDFAAGEFFFHVKIRPMLATKRPLTAAVVVRIWVMRRSSRSSWEETRTDGNDPNERAPSLPNLN
jgi:hypothetical protein